MRSSYRGRFAPTPSGPLHRGSIVAALASWLDARAHGGRWLVRIEDTDQPRCVPGADALILKQLQQLGLHSDEPVQWQSQRGAHYQAALDHLVRTNRAYGCACSRQDIETALAQRGLNRTRHAAAVYPGTCRTGTQGRAVRAWRARTGDGEGPVHIQWQDRRLGPQVQELAAEVGDFVIRRADGWWAYQLAVVVDDALQGITHVVRGEDLCDNTPRQIFLQSLLGAPRPHYLHTPLVWAEDGQKLSKQTGAQAVDCRDPLAVLTEAAAVLGLDVPNTLQEERALEGPPCSAIPATATMAASANAPTTPPYLRHWLKAATRAWARQWCVSGARA